MVEIESVFLLALKPFLTFYGRYAKIIGLYMYKGKLCYHVENYNGVKDYISVCEIAEGTYKMVAQSEINKQTYEASITQ